MKKKIIVIGGGFAGLQFLLKLPKNEFDILLIDKLNHHQFQPLFYQVATSQIEPSSISFPLRRIFYKRADVRIRLANVIGFDSERKILNTSIGDFEYDYLVIATGCKTNFFGNEKIAKNVYTLKTTHQAIDIRNSILSNFEKLVHAEEADKEPLQNIVIVGGGATGVELAGAFAEIKSDILPGDYPRIDFSHLKIYLIEGSNKTLSAMSPVAQKHSERYLRNMGVEVKLGLFVKDYDGETLELSDGSYIKSKQVIWAAGVTGNMIGGIPEGSVARGNRIKVNRYSQVESLKDVYAIGDISYMETPKYPNGHPQVANVATNQGKNLSNNLMALKNGSQLSKYEYKDLGSLATIGRNKAVVDLPGIRFRGYFAWFFWMFLHLMLILKVRNKLIIFINWAGNYFTQNSSLRLILKGDDES